MRTLSKDQRNIVQNAMADVVLDSMSKQDLEDFAYLQLLDTYDKMTTPQFVSLVKAFHPELLK